jgi:hypothetical protein
MNQAQAQSIAEAVIREMTRGQDVEFVILEGYSKEHATGWMFAYNTKAFAETGDRAHLLRGPGPLFVSKENGTVFSFGTSTYDIEAVDRLQAELAEFGEDGLSDEMKGRRISLEELEQQ